MRTLIATLVVVAVGIGALAWATHGGQALTAEGARRLAVADRPRPVPDFPLQTQDGTRTRFEVLEGRLVVATFIYTRCRTMCPLLGMRMARIREALPKGALSKEVRLLSLSFDPERDRPPQLRDYGRRYGAEPGHWWVARPLEGLEEVLDTFGVVVIPTGQDFRHNAAFYLIDRRGRLAGIYDEEQPERVVEAVRARL